MTTTLTLPRDVAQQLLQAMQPLLLLAQKSHMGLALLPAAQPGTLQASAVNTGLALARAVREFELAVAAARESKAQADSPYRGSGAADLTPSSSLRQASQNGTRRPRRSAGPDPA